MRLNKGLIASISTLAAVAMGGTLTKSDSEAQAPDKAPKTGVTEGRTGTERAANRLKAIEKANAEVRKNWTMPPPSRQVSRAGWRAHQKAERRNDRAQARYLSQAMMKQRRAQRQAAAKAAKAAQDSHRAEA